MPEDKEQLAVNVPARVNPRLAKNMEDLILRLVLGNPTSLSSAERALFVDPRQKGQMLNKALIDPDTREAYTLPPNSDLDEHDDIARLLGFIPKKERNFNQMRVSFPYLNEAVHKGMLRYGTYQAPYDPGRYRDYDQMMHFLPRPSTNKLALELMRKHQQTANPRSATHHITLADRNTDVFEEGTENQFMFGDQFLWGQHPAYRGPIETSLDYMSRILSGK